MLVKAEPLSKKKDNMTWCRPNKSYQCNILVEIELNDYKECDTVKGELPDSDEDWPKGAPMTNYVKVGDKIFKKIL